MIQKSWFRIGCIFFVVALLMHMGYIEMPSFAVFQSNTVTVTKESPAIEINGIQYHYEPFDLTISKETLRQNHMYDDDPDYRACDRYAKPGYDTEDKQLVGLFNGHKVIVNYDLLRYGATRASKNFDDTCRIGLSSSSVSEYAGAIEVKDAYFDGSYVEVSGKTPKVGTLRPYDYVDRKEVPNDYYFVNENGGKYRYYYHYNSDKKIRTKRHYNVYKEGDFFECKWVDNEADPSNGPGCNGGYYRDGLIPGDMRSEYMWINVNDILIKFQISNTDVGASHPDRSYYFGYKDYVVKAFIYVPETYFESASCGDGNCDLSENCKTCEQDCGVCVVPDCGNGICSADENFAVCPADCEPIEPFCGDGFCNGVETCANCAQDCGECQLQYCGNGDCGGDETCVTCDLDCGVCPSVCGDGKCENAENGFTCPLDCGIPQDACGNGVCDSTEDCRCEDCTCDSSTICSPDNTNTDVRGCELIVSDITDPEPPQEETNETVELDPDLPDDVYGESDGIPTDITVYILLAGIVICLYFGFIRR